MVASIFLRIGEFGIPKIATDVTKMKYDYCKMIGARSDKIQRCGFFACGCHDNPSFVLP
jgi:hypothetical protein